LTPVRECIAGTLWFLKTFPEKNIHREISPLRFPPVEMTILLPGTSFYR
jgi:hypothetical protein